MDKAQQEFMQNLARKKRAVLLGTLPLQPLLWWGISRTSPDSLGLLVACIAGFVLSAMLTWVVGEPVLNSRHY